jgi:SAM-dependent methyltransferase
MDWVRRATNFKKPISVGTSPASGGENNMTVTGRCLFYDGELGEIMFKGVRDKRGVSEKEWDFRRCNQCGSAVLDPMPTLEELLAAYPPVYHVDQVPQTSWFHRLQYTLEARFFYEPVYRFSVRQVQRVTGLRTGRMLDVGGGSGHRSFFFQRAGFDVTFLDPDERALKVARERFGLKTICGLLEEVNLPENSFDLVTFWFVVEHLPEPQKTLKAAYKVLKPNGWVVALVPITDSWQARLFKERWHEVWEAPRHVALPSTQGMKALFAKTGFVFCGKVGDSTLYNAGGMAVSLCPESGVHACARTKTLRRLLLRLTGAIMTICFLPLAYLEGKFGSAGDSIFFAQKPS